MRLPPPVILAGRTWTLGARETRRGPMFLIAGAVIVPVRVRAWACGLGDPASDRMTRPTSEATHDFTRTSRMAHSGRRGVESAPLAGGLCTDALRFLNPSTAASPRSSLRGFRDPA